MTKARDLANAADVLDDVSATELSYVNGVTSAIQTQLNAKQAVVSGVDDTEIGYLNGVTSAIQTQIDSKIGSASAISPTLIDAKGDLIVGSAADTAARLAVGTNDHVLTADSSATNGVKWAAPAGGGKVLQVVQSLTTGYVAITSNNTYEDANLSATITPTSSSSKILVMITQAINFYTDSAAQPNSAWCRIMRGGTAVWNASPTESTIGLVRAALDGPRLIMAINYLDNPATTSAITYKPQYKQESNANAHTIYMNYGGIESTITLMEIGA